MSMQGKLDGGMWEPKSKTISKQNGYFRIGSWEGTSRRGGSESGGRQGC